jgi:predicted DNA-binding transcriptional regulator AlpA
LNLNNPAIRWTWSVIMNSNLELLDRRQLSAFLGGLHASTIYRLVARGIIPKPIEVGASSRWLLSECRECLVPNVGGTTMSTNPDYNNLGFHELASLMAMIEGKAKEDFKADIKLKGIQTKMMLFEGRLLDGRNRYTCGKELGFEFSEKDFDLFTGTYAEAEAYVISTNMMRRQMTNTQKAEVVERMIRKYPDDSNRKIAARCGMSSHSFVATVRERMENPPERREFDKLCKAFDNLDDGFCPASALVRQN